MESIVFKLEATRCAVLDHVLNQFEEVLADFRVRNRVIFYHLQGRLAKAEHNLLEEVLKLFAHLLEQGREEHKHFGVTSILASCTVVIDKGLECGQHSCAELLEICFFQKVGLD